MGVVSGIKQMVAAQNIICVPLNVTNGQATRVVVKYIDERPQRQHEAFAPLVIEALSGAFPSCKK